MITEDEGPIRNLKDRLAAISDIGGASSLLFWDQQTHMPEGGVAGRAEQMATLSRLSHEMLASDETGALHDSIEEPEPGTDGAAILRIARRDYERATKLPTRLVEELSRTRALAEPAWARARANSDWSAFAPHLEKILPLARESAEHLGYEDHPYDPLLDLYEPGMKRARLREIFDELKSELVPMIRDVAG